MPVNKSLHVELWILSGPGTLPRFCVVMVSSSFVEFAKNCQLHNPAGIRYFSIPNPRVVKTSAGLETLAVLVNSPCPRIMYMTVVCDRHRLCTAGFDAEISCITVRHVTTGPRSSSSSSSAAAAAADLTHLISVKLSISLSVHILHLEHFCQHKQNSHHLTSPNNYSNRVSEIPSTCNVTSMLSTGCHSQQLKWVTFGQHTILAFNQPPRPTQPGHPSVDRQMSVLLTMVMSTAVKETGLLAYRPGCLKVLTVKC